MVSTRPGDQPVSSDLCEINALRNPAPGDNPATGLAELTRQRDALRAVLAPCFPVSRDEFFPVHIPHLVRMQRAGLLEMSRRRRGAYALTDLGRQALGRVAV